MADLVGWCVLIVEDEPIIAFDLATTLEEAGAAVLGPAMNLEQAESLSSNGAIAAAVLDVRLGEETIAPVASKLASRGVPLIFHTGHADAAQLARHWPHCRVLLKPARPDELLSALSAVIGASQA